MHGYDAGYGPPPPLDMYSGGPPPPGPPPPHGDLPLMPGMPPFPGHEPPPPGHLGPGPGFHHLEGETAGGLLPPPGPGEEFSAAFGDPDCGGQPIEGKV